MRAWGFWGAVAAFVALMWAVAFWMRKRRTAALKKAAKELGVPFRPKGDQSLVHRLAGFDLRAQYRSFGNRPLRNLLQGHSDGKEFAIFDYRCRKEHSQNSPSTMTVLLIEWAELDLPTFVARPESIFKKLG